MDGANCSSVFVCYGYVVTARALYLEQKGSHSALAVFCSSSVVLKSIFVQVCSLPCSFSVCFSLAGRLLCKEMSAIPVGSLMSSQLSKKTPCVLAYGAADS